MSRSLITALGLLVLVEAVTPIQAIAVTYPLDFIFSPSTGTVPPIGNVVMTDLGATVRFDVTNQAGAGSKLDSLYFNFAQGSLNPSQLMFSNVSAAAGTYQTLLAATGGTTNNNLKADGDGYYDGKIQYTTNNFLGNSQTLSFELGIVNESLNVGDFQLHSIPGGGTGTYVMASHIQSLPNGGGSVWVGALTPVPVPAAMWLFGSGLATMIGFARGGVHRRDGV